MGGRRWQWVAAAWPWLLVHMVLDGLPVYAGVRGAGSCFIWSIAVWVALVVVVASWVALVRIDHDELGLLVRALVHGGVGDAGGGGGDAARRWGWSGPLRYL